MEHTISYLRLARFEILTGPMSAEATVADTHAVDGQLVSYHFGHINVRFLSEVRRWAAFERVREVWA